MLIQRFEQQMSEALHLRPNQVKLILAVSGGVDSIVLTDLVAKMGFDFMIAHCNFQLRGEESDRDEIFVRSLEEKYTKIVLVKKFATARYAAERKISVQEAARELRYEWFQQLLKTDHEPAGNGNQLHPDNFTPSYLVTAHHANDNIETLLINFFRGTGITGLHGIPARYGKVIRPLLFAKREEIIAYAAESKLLWVEDSSNALDKYTRNFFRLKIIPALKDVFPNVEDNLLHNIEKFKDAEILYQQAVEHHIKKLWNKIGNEIHLPILLLQKSEPVNSIIWEIIKSFDFHPAQVTEVKKLFVADNGSYVSSSSHRIIRNRRWLIIAPLQAVPSANILIEGNDKKIQFDNNTLEFEKIPASQVQLVTSANTAYLDAAEIRFPLLLRKWKKGDYFYPLGMHKKKKLGKFFIDLKLSKTEKEKIWILEMNKKIVWVTGYRIDDRFKITGSTQKVLRISLHKLTML